MLFKVLIQDRDTVLRPSLCGFDSLGVDKSKLLHSGEELGRTSWVTVDLTNYFKGR